jgi:hypothetical protein
MLASTLMPRVPTGAPFEERGGRLRGALDLIAGRYPRFVFGGGVGQVLPVFHFHEATRATLEPSFAYLVENGYRTVDSAAVAALARDGRHPGPRTVVLAFDDAWASLWLVVGPLLRRFGLRAVAYAIPGRIADAPSVRPTADEGPVDAVAADRAQNPFVTWPELRALSSAGLVDVQSHTWSHSMMFSGDVVIGRNGPALASEPMLNRPRADDGRDLEFLTPDRLGFPLFQRRSRMSDGRRFYPDPEECASRETLEAHLRAQVRHVCLPWGVSGARTRAALERTGFLTAFANRLGGRFAVASGDQPYSLKRLNERYVFALPGHGRRTLAIFA